MEDKYEFDTHMQQVLLGAMLKDLHFLRQAHSLVKPYYFEDDVHVILCKMIIDYFDKYKSVPKEEYLINEINEKFTDEKDQNRRECCFFELKTLLNIYEIGLENIDYLTDKIAEFSKIQHLREAMNEVIDMLKSNKTENKWTKIYNTLTTALNVEKQEQFETVDYFSSIEERYRRMKESRITGDVFTSGFEQIDAALTAGGMCRQEVAVWLGQSGTGKSLMLLKGAAHNFAKGKKILFISLEMSADKVAARADSYFSMLPPNEILHNQKIVEEALNEAIEPYDDKKRFLIKQFPAGTLDIKTLRAYLSQIEMSGFKPDAVFLDYIGEMKFDTSIPLHLALYNTVRDLRGLAAEQNIYICSAVQGNRFGKESQGEGEMLDDSKLAGSYSIVKPLDALWSINMTPQEKNANVGKIYVSKHRDGRDGFYFFYKRENNLNTIEIDKKKYAEIMTTFSNKSSEGVELSKVFKQNG